MDCVRAGASLSPSCHCTPDAVLAAVCEIRTGSVGGDCVFRFDGTLPIWARIMYPIAVFLARRRMLVGGCFLFCSRAAFDAIGGFCERYYAAEEAAFIRALKERGRFVVPKPEVVTSGRKLRANSCWKIIREAWRWVAAGPESYPHGWQSGPTDGPLGICYPWVRSAIRGRNSSGEVGAIRQDGNAGPHSSALHLFAHPRRTDMGRGGSFPSA